MSIRSVMRYVTLLSIVPLFYLICLIHPAWLPFYHPFHLNYSHLSNSYAEWSIGKQLASVYSHVMGHRSETEGWYLKVHLPDDHPNCRSTPGDGRQPICEFAVIFLWYTDPDPDRSHSSVQFYDATNLQNHRYLRPLDSFRSDPLPSWKQFYQPHNKSAGHTNPSNNISLYIDDNKLSLSSVVLDVAPSETDSVTARVKLNIQMQPSDKLPAASSERSPLSFDSLTHTVGILGFLPLSCFQQMIMMQLDVVGGSLDVDGRRVDLTGAEAYIEKTWGRTFPKEYLWMHATRFVDISNTPSHAHINSLFFSVADVPLFGSVSSPGFVTTLVYDNRYIHFASHLGSIISMILSEPSSVVVRLYDQEFHYELVIELDRTLDVGQHPEAWLYAAKDGSMQQSIKQQIGRDTCTVTLNQLMHVNQSTAQPTNEQDEFRNHNFARNQLARARTKAIGLEVMMQPDGHLLTLIHELHDLMRPWSKQWTRLNTPYVSISLPSSVFAAAFRMIVYDIDAAGLLRSVTAISIAICSIVFLKRVS